MTDKQQEKQVLSAQARTDGEAAEEGASLVARLNGEHRVALQEVRPHELERRLTARLRLDGRQVAARWHAAAWRSDTARRERDRRALLGHVELQSGARYDELDEAGDAALALQERQVLPRARRGAREGDVVDARRRGRLAGVHAGLARARALLGSQQVAEKAAALVALAAALHRRTGENRPPGVVVQQQDNSGTPCQSKDQTSRSDF